MNQKQRKKNDSLKPLGEKSIDESQDVRWSKILMWDT